MKAATGELQLTVITMIAIAAVIGLFWFMWNNGIQDSIKSQWESTSDREKSQGQQNGLNNGVSGIVINDFTVSFSK